MMDGSKKGPRDGEMRLVHLTKRLLLEQGPEVSVERICEEAGLSKGAFYHHFPTKRALMIRALRALPAGDALPTDALLRLLPLARRDREVARILRPRPLPRPVGSAPDLTQAMLLGEAICEALSLPAAQ